MSASEPGESAQYLTFFLAGEEYAAGILRVREILQYEPVTRIPTAPPWIRGVMNLRGSVVPVVDLALKFGLPETAVTKWTCVLIVELELEGQHAMMGVMADAVSEVIDLRPEDIEPPPPFGTSVRVDYLLGMGKVPGKKFVLLLDLDRVLSAAELLSATAAAAEEQAPAPEEGPGSPAEEAAPQPEQPVPPPPGEPGAPDSSQGTP